MAKLIEALKNKASNEPSQESSQESNPTLEKVAFLEAQVQGLQQQLQARSQEERDKKLEQEAERIKAEEAALREETDLRKTLADAFSTSTRGQGDMNDEALSQKEMMEILADAVGKATEAQSKLVMGEVAKLLNETNNKIGVTQKALIEVMAGLDVSQAQAKHADFNDYRQDIAELMGRTNLSSEEAYLLAKAKGQASAPGTGERVSSERPSNIPAPYARESSASTQQEQGSVDENEYVNPRAAFRGAVSQAIDKVLASRR